MGVDVLKEKMKMGVITAVIINISYLINILCLSRYIAVADSRSVRFSKPNKPITISEKTSLTDEEKAYRRKLGDDLMNELFSNKFAEEFSPLHRRDQAEGGDGAEISTMDSLLRENINTMGPVDSYKKTHTSGDGDSSIRDSRYGVQNDEQTVEEKKLLVKEIVDVYKEIDQSDIEKKGLTQLTVYGSFFYETNRKTVDTPNNFAPGYSFQITGGKEFANLSGEIVGNIRGNCFYGIDFENVSLCTFGLAFQSAVGVEVGYIHVQGTTLRVTDDGTSFFSVTGGTGIFAGASGSAIFDQTLTDNSLYSYKFIITLYEFWDNPFVETVAENTRTIFN